MTLKAKFGKLIEVHNTERRKLLIEKVEKCPFPIKELHIFTHSIGGGLFISYGDSTINSQRNTLILSAAGAGRKVTYKEVVDTEVGAILTDHFVTATPLAGKRDALRKKFAPDALIKIWGCNSGITEWVYSDSGGAKYWTALNEDNTPKPAVAQAFADFFNVNVLGAQSGANIQVKYKKAWIYADVYKKLTGRFAGEPELLRLNPTSGGYKTYKPAGS